MEIVPKPNPDVILKTYEVISKYLEEEKEEEGNDLKFDFPTPETLQKLCEPQTVKNVLT